MPMIQLLRRDSSVIELEAESISFGFNRVTLTYPVAIFATRMGMDLNQSDMDIVIEGIFSDDDTVTPGVGAAFHLDLSRGGGISPASTWFNQYSSWSVARADLDGVEITFSSASQINANLGEDITIRLKNGTAASATVATNSVFEINISGAASSDAVADLILSAINGASAKVNTVTTDLNDIFTVTQSSGQQTNLSASQQSSTFDGEMITLINKTVGISGNSTVNVSKDNAGQEWAKQFIVTNMSGGKESLIMTKEDKVQDVLNLANMSAGGALISPQILTGSVIDLPNSVASFDTSRFLSIEDSSVVAKYIVGIRVPYESLASSTTGARVLRQFLIPAGPGTNYPAEGNTYDYDPTVTVDNKTIRPNPFLEQGVAIPAIIKGFTPSYNAGEGHWTYTLTMSPIEQLVGL
tara:strand:- start:3465 stop:4694 length:1230 start_codon:yes stop_codon:yes gene_type:complete